MKIDEVGKWRPFTDTEGSTWDLSFLDAHEVIYTHRCEGKAENVAPLRGEHGSAAASTVFKIPPHLNASAV